jgi:hypothetical protein
MTDKIIKFPDKNGSDNIFPSNAQESLEFITQVRKDFCDEVASDVFDAVLAILNNYGMSFNGNITYVKDLTFVEEGIKSMIYRIKRLEHPMQPVVDQTINISDELKEEIKIKVDDSLKTH